MPGIPSSPWNHILYFAMMSVEQALGSHQLWGGKVVTFDEV
jgi:hypothetical protein